METPTLAYAVTTHRVRWHWLGIAATLFGLRAAIGFAWDFWARRSLVSGGLLDMLGPWYFVVDALPAAAQALVAPVIVGLFCGVICRTVPGARWGRGQRICLGLGLLYALLAMGSVGIGEYHLYATRRGGLLSMAGLARIGSGMEIAAQFVRLVLYAAGIGFMARVGRLNGGRGIGVVGVCGFGMVLLGAAFTIGVVAVTYTLIFFQGGAGGNAFFDRMFPFFRGASMGGSAVQVVLGGVLAVLAFVAAGRVGQSRSEYRL